MGGPGCSPGAAGLRGWRSWSRGHPQDTRSPAAPPSLPSPSVPPTPLPAPAPPPTNREGKFPGARNRIRAFSGLPAAEAGRGAGARGGRQPEGAQDEARRGGWAAAAVSSVPAHRAAITARRRLPAGRRHRREGGGGPGRGRGRALTCRRGTRQSSQMGRRCGKWKGEKGGRAMRAVKQLSSNARLSRTALGAPLPRPPTPPAPAMVESAYGECRGPLLCDRGRPRDPCSERLRAAPSALEPSLSPSGGPGTPKLGTADNSVSEKWSQHKDLSLEFYQNYVNILIHHHLLATYFYGLFKRSICISKISFLGHIPFVVGFYL